ncbi:MAG: alpha/beta fold hydrolase [Cytophagales bacterium]
MANIIGNFQTVWYSLSRIENSVFSPQLKLFKTSDDDFLELDFYEINSQSLTLIFHGLESSSKQAYVLGMTNRALEFGSDVIAVNFRGCGKEMNKQFRSYHSGASDDLKELIDYYVSNYKLVNSVGFSLGANVLLKYLGENPKNCLNSAIAISSPLDLFKTVKNLENNFFGIYQQHFLKKLKSKLVRKAKLFPEHLKMKEIEKISTLKALDDYYTAPAHGFKDALDYYSKCSSIHFLSSIQTPCLIINALNDPFYTGINYKQIVSDIQNPNLEWCLPKFGGHVGFGKCGKKTYFHEEEAMKFWKRVSTNKKHSI